MSSNACLRPPTCSATARDSVWSWDLAKASQSAHDRSKFQSHIFLFLMHMLCIHHASNKMKCLPCGPREHHRRGNGKKWKRKKSQGSQTQRGCSTHKL
ncbi:hypothetical protein LEMLEM_LOCUS20981 [Lemmus lemmus]